MVQIIATKRIGRFLLAATAALALVVGCQREHRTPAPSVGVATVARYVGDDACKPCHYTVFEQHRASAHAGTLRAMDRADLGLVAPPVGPIPGSPFAVEQRGRIFYLTRKDADITLSAGEPRAVPFVYAYGSGKNGVSYVALDQNDTLIEAHYSYVPHRRKWRVTPGQEDAHLSPNSIGITRPDEIWRECQRCHGVVSGGSVLRPDLRIKGVGCESCHGAGSNHIDSMRRAAFHDLKIERMGTWSARKLNADCGRCHRTEKDLIPGAPPAAQTARFQPYGLMQSQCFLKSGDSLSCLSCHNPHGDTQAITQVSEQACKTCHSTQASPPPLAGKPAVRGALCPVNPNSGCVRCHMPLKPAYGLKNIQMADHDIRIWRAGQPNREPNPPHPNPSP